MCPLGANIWPAPQLEQERSGEAIRFVRGIRAHNWTILDLSLHSVGMRLRRLAKYDGFLRLVNDALVDEAGQVVRLAPSHLPELAKASERFNLGFHDGCRARHWPNGIGRL